MSILLFFIFTYILMSVSLYFLFPKAEVAGVKGLIPGVNFGAWAELIGRKKSYAWMLLIPIVNLFVLSGMSVDLVRSFGKLKFWHAALAVIFPPAIFFLIAKDETAKYEGPILVSEAAYQSQLSEAVETKNERLFKKLVESNPYKKSQAREWVEAIVFAVFAAAFIRMFLIEAYVIPTSSMEGSLNVGDYLFVSKVNYGIRTPETILMVPLLHNRLPFFNKESYITKPSLTPYRLPAIESIDNNDPVVFNYPEGDSVYVTPGRTFSIYDLRRVPAIRNQIGNIPLDVRPIDKKDHYIKRCVGIAGDSLQIINRQVHINGKPLKNSKNIQFRYWVSFKKNSLNTSKFEEWGINLDQNEDIKQMDSTTAIIILNEEQKAKVQSMDASIKIEEMEEMRFKYGGTFEALTGKVQEWGMNTNFMNRDEENNIYALISESQKKKVLADSLVKVIPMGGLFPHAAAYANWTIDNYGPIYIPKKGATIPLNTSNLPFYERLIRVYENNDLSVRGNRIFINDQPVETYTFKQDYYWMQGDNRHNSEDSRVWGFVPFDHVVGKPLFIWFSTNKGNMRNGINWDRLFTGGTKMD